jgi:2-polyprenyl-3-methyl-5-hydroxy-6-metoxy-1,4-benzoquinol methylase
MEIQIKSVELAKKNSVFWDELCGTGLAKYLGITNSSEESLKRFDDWYFDFYPYLSDHIPFESLKGKNVLEIGLGYGTVSQRLAMEGSNYIGLDIASGPVDMVNHRLKQVGASGQAIQGSILDPEFVEDTFDYIIAIGCLHHTGNLQLAIDNCLKLLRPGGRLIFMVYNAYSYRRFRIAPLVSLKTLFKEVMGYRGVVGASNQSERAAYDASSDGAAAPHTDWISIRSLEHFCRNFSTFTAKLENIDQELPFLGRTRAQLLLTKWPAVMGLDLYATAIK